MTDSPTLENEASVNDRSLKRLVRALTFSQGRFSLNFVRCNYAELQAEMQQRLQAACAFELCHLVLPKTAQTLFSAIKTTLHDRQPSALMVSGFESVAALESLLIATNQVRDDFRKSFAFPLVLWMDDEVLKKLMRSAPDFSSWAGVPMQFAIDTDALIALLTRETDALFTVAMDVGAGRFPRSSALYPEIGSHSRGQLRLALKELGDRGQPPPPALKASLDFILGQAAYADEQMDEARHLYEQSLGFWQRQEAKTQEPGANDRETDDRESPIVDASRRIERLGCVLFYLGLWWRRWAVLHRAEPLSACRKARDYYQQCIQVLLEGDRPDLAAKFINALGEVLLRLVKADRVWAELEAVAQTAVGLHKRYGDPLRLAYSDGLLAEVALSKAAWAQAADYAQQALDHNDQPPEPALEAQPQYADRRWMKQHYGSLYLLLWVQAQQHLDLSYAEAVKTLERARAQCHHAYDPLLYIRILETLRSTHYRQQQYVKACETKRDQRSIEQQYSLRAFIGAVRLRPERQVINPALIPIELPEAEPEATPETTSGDDRADVLPPQAVMVAQEIIASGRYRDVERLLKRLSEPRYNLTIIHGQSGVGKSSIIGAGLVPALKQHPIGDRSVLPVVLRNYEKWQSGLGLGLQEALNAQGIHETVPGLGEPSDPPDIQPLLEQLRVNADRRSLLTVLVFDQFEAFFFTYLHLGDRRPFLDFLHQCLNHLPFVKIVLSLRQDYLHYLLESSRLYSDDITDNILSRDKRYPLGNFSIADTKTIIEQLTQRSEFHLESALIDQLVTDLSAEQQEVRPIELQLVGAQLQDSDITTLHAYQALGLFPKEKLVERFLEQVIQDCGAENKQTATLVLYLLTDERGTRPLKTQTELVANLQDWEFAAEADPIALVLAIFVMSGLVLEMPEVSVKRYQLTHDYLATLVRQKLNQEAEAYKINQQFEKQNDATREHDRKQQQRVLTYAHVATVLALPALLFAGFAWDHMNAAAIAEIAANISLASGLARANDQLEALTQSINAGVKFNAQRQRPDTWLLPLGAIEAPTVGKLLEAVYNTQEQQRLIGHHLWVNSVSFSPQTHLFASASADRTIILWREDGTLLHRLEGHTSGVNSVSISPDGQTLASASADQTIKLWDTEGHLLATLTGHTAPVTSVSFSPDGKTLASASDDQTVKLWDRRTRKLLTTLMGNTDRVKAVRFSPDGTLLATAGWDGTARLWKRDGTLLRQFSSDLVQLCEASKTSLSAALKQANIQAETLCREHPAKLTSVSFSPDGQTIAVGSWDNTVQRWSIDGTPLQTLIGHTDRVTSVDFSPNGKLLLSASNDGTIKLWNLQTGIETSTLTIPGVSSARFLGSDGGRAGATAVVTTGADQSVRLWQLKPTQPKTLVYETPVTSMSFSPDGQWIASASLSFGQDQTLLAKTPDRTAQRRVETSINGQIKLWNLKNKAVKPLSLTGSFKRVLFSPDSRTLASAENSIAPNGQVNSQVKLWSLDGTLLNQQSIAGEIADIAFTADAQTLAIAENNSPSKAPLQQPEPIQGGVIFWDLERNTAQKRLIQDSKINSLSFSNKGTIATGSDDGIIRLWAKNGQALNPLKGHTDVVNSVSFSPDGNIASASADSTIRLWSASGQPLRTLTGDDSPVASVSFSRDSRLLLSGSEAGTIKVWEVADGSLLATLQPSDRRINSVSFSPSGKLIAAAGNDNQVQLWQFDLDPLLSLGCKWLKPYLATTPTLADRTLCAKIDPATGDR